MDIPFRFYDYVMYYEAHPNEKLNPSAWKNIGSLSPGSLLDAVNWNYTGYLAQDNAGITRFGITPNAISAYKSYSKNYSFELMSKESWKQVVGMYWNTSFASSAANLACGILMCQGKWQGWGTDSLNSTITELKNKCGRDTTGLDTSNSYRAIAQLTNCFDNPMDAFIILRNKRIEYLRSRSNSKANANGWMRREFFAMQPDGLYCEPGSAQFTKYGFTPIDQMQAVADQLKLESSSGYVKLLDWGARPTDDKDTSTYDTDNDFSFIKYESPYSTSYNGANIIRAGSGPDVVKEGKTKGIVLGIHINQKG